MRVLCACLEEWSGEGGRRNCFYGKLVWLHHSQKRRQKFLMADAYTESAHLVILVTLILTWFHSICFWCVLEKLRVSSARERNATQNIIQLRYRNWRQFAKPYLKRFSPQHCIATHLQRKQYPLKCQVVSRIDKNPHTHQTRALQHALQY